MEMKKYYQVESTVVFLNINPVFHHMATAQRSKMLPAPTSCPLTPINNSGCQVMSEEPERED